MSAERLPPPRAITAHKDPKLPAPPAFDDETTWWASLTRFDAAQAQALLAVARTLCPHDDIAERVYRRVVAQLDRACAQLPARGDQVEALLQALDTGFPVPFAARSESYRVTALAAQQQAPAFRFLQRGVVRHLYDDLEVWQAFGYEGASYHLGGFVTRGFDDLAWLPAAPAAPSA